MSLQKENKEIKAANDEIANFMGRKINELHDKCNDLDTQISNEKMCQQELYANLKIKKKFEKNTALAD